MSRRRLLAASLLVGLLGGPVALATAAAPPADSTTRVEIIGDDSARAEVAALGGTITAEVPGEVAQAVLPTSKVDDLQAAMGDDVTVRPVRRVNQPPGPMPTEGFGATVGQASTVMNAEAWQAVGINGSGVRVGIIDFFDMSRWNEAEHGTRPTVANGRRFCRDTTGLAPSLCSGLDFSLASADPHGVAVAEIVKDVAPGAELFIATAGSLNDMYAAIDWFAANGVRIITRSIGAAYDGAGDGTGPLAAVVDYAANRSIVWFNSAGNDAAGGYARWNTGPVSVGQYVPFAPGVDSITLNIGGQLWLDGLRWNDWDVPSGQRNDYVIEVYSAGVLQFTIARPTLVDDQPLIGADFFDNQPPLQTVDIKIKKTRAGARASNTMELGLANGSIPASYADVAYSAAKPVVDSGNPMLIAVGAVEGSSNWNTPAYYSSQGPTNDERKKPDVAAPSCVLSTIYAGCFRGTSAASPAAAGAAALLLQSGVAPGLPLANAVRAATRDVGTAGTDNQTGAGVMRLPDPPVAAINSSPTTYAPLAAPTRLLDTRSGLFLGGGSAPVGPFAAGSVIDLDVRSSLLVPDDATAVAINLTSVNSNGNGYLQALPTRAATIGSTSTLNLSSLGARANFAIVPIGANGSISIYLQAGGDAVIDVYGSFVPAGGTTASGRFVAVQPERWVDTREPTQQPIYGFGVGGPRPMSAGETVIVPRLGATAVPAAGVAALVVNVTGTNVAAPGWLRAEPVGAAGLTHSTVNIVPGDSAANLAIVPVDANGAIAVSTLQPTDVVVDVIGYVTNAAAPQSGRGLFVAVSPGRLSDTREIASPYGIGEVRLAVPVGQAPPRAAVPANASGVAVNLTVTEPAVSGWLRAWPQFGTQPPTSNVNYAAGSTVANGALIGLDAGALLVQMNQPGHVIIDVNGYFTG